jgi:hypothetical protein
VALTWQDELGEIVHRYWLNEENLSPGELYAQLADLIEAEKQLSYEEGRAESGARWDPLSQGV